MQRKRVNSSKIRSVGYDEATRTLEVEMSNGQASSTAASIRGVPTLHGRAQSDFVLRRQDRRGIHGEARVD